MKGERKNTGDPILGGKIFAARKARGWSQADLATASGHIQTQINKWEKGEVRIYADQLLAVARALELSCDYLIDPTMTEAPPVPIDEQRRRFWTVAEAIGVDAAERHLREFVRASVGKPLPTVRRGEPLGKDAVGEDEPANP